jgi:hypothetical protein
VRELRPGELQQYNVVRVGDEILVDLMRSAGGIDYAEASKNVVAPSGWRVNTSMTMADLDPAALRSANGEKKMDRLRVHRNMRSL